MLRPAGQFLTIRFPPVAAFAIAQHAKLWTGRSPWGVTLPWILDECGGELFHCGQDVIERKRGERGGAVRHRVWVCASRKFGHVVKCCHWPSSGNETAFKDDQIEHMKNRGKILPPIQNAEMLNEQSPRRHAHGGRRRVESWRRVALCHRRSRGPAGRLPLL